MTPTTNSTVFSRAKRTGFLIGPHHKMDPGMTDNAPSATPLSADGPGSDTAPPNLRDSPAPENCGECANYSGSGASSPEDPSGTPNQCMKFNTSVTPNQVCDDFTEGGTDNGENEATEPVQGQAGPQAG